MELSQPIFLQGHIQHLGSTGIEAIHLLSQFADSAIQH
jgi:hypothetical protein